MSISSNLAMTDLEKNKIHTKEIKNRKKTKKKNKDNSKFSKII